MSLDDVEYYRRRAVQERERAANAETTEASSAHLELATHYEGLIARAEMLPLSRDMVANRNETDPDPCSCEEAD